MSEPVLTLEVALATDPTAATQLWTDLTAWWLADDDWSTKYGRTSEREKFPAGTAKLRLDNADRRFDPLNTSGPYAALTVTTTLTAAVVSTTATTITVASSASLPTDVHELVIGTETMLVTAGFGTGTLTVQRGYDGTTAATHLNGATVTWYTPGLLPDRKMRITAMWNLLSERTAAPLDGVPDQVGTWVNKSNAEPPQASAANELQMIWTLSGSEVVVQSGSGTSNIAAEEGATYTAIASFKTTTATPACSVGLEFLNAAGVAIGTATYGTPVATSTGAYTQATHTATAPAGTAFVAVLLKRAAALGTGLVIEMGLFPADTAPLWEAGGPDTLFVGYVEGWPQTWEHPGHGYVDLDATDATEPLNLARLPQSPYEIEVLKANPSAMWPLYDEVGATVALDAVGGRHGAYDAPRVAGAALVAADPRTGLGRTFQFAVNPEARGFVRLPTAARPQGAAWTITWLATVPEITTTTAYAEIIQIGRQTFDGVGGQIRFAVDSAILATPLVLSVRDTAGNGTFLYVAAPSADAPHHFALAYTGTDVVLFIDGVVAGSVTPVAGLSLIDDFFRFGLGEGNNDDHSATYAALTVFDGVALDGSTILDHAATSAVPWASDTTGQRITRILDAIGWPAADRDIDVGDSDLGPVESVVGASALSLMQGVEETEAGALYVTTGGKVRFRSRRAIYTAARSTAVVAVFSDDPTGGQYAMGDNIRPQLDDEFVVTESRVRRSASDSSEQVSTSPHRSRHFLRSMQRTLDLFTDAEAQSRAEWDISLYGEAKTRIDGLTLRPTTDQSLWPLILSLGIGDRVRVITTPLGAGAQVTIDGLIEGRDISVDKDDGWAVTYRLNTRETAPVWRWGISLWGVDTRWAL